MSTQKEVTYTTSNTYHTLNPLTEKTKNIWLVFHGMGYLSKYFINYFSELNAAENYIVAPQAPSKYYQDKTFTHVGASWLTREETTLETKNVLNYIDKVFERENIGEIPNLIIVGYSQGVSIATRWVASRKIQCSALLLLSGGIPKELQAEDFEFLKPGTRVIYRYGSKDPYITEARKTEEHLKGNQLFHAHLEIGIFNGVHEVDKRFLLSFSKQF